MAVAAHRWRWRWRWRLEAPGLAAASSLSCCGEDGCAMRRNERTSTFKGGTSDDMLSCMALQIRQTRQNSRVRLVPRGSADGSTILGPTLRVLCADDRPLPLACRNAEHVRVRPFKAESVRQAFMHACSNNFSNETAVEEERSGGAGLGVGIGAAGLVSGVLLKGRAGDVVVLPPSPRFPPPPPLGWRLAYILPASGLANTPPPAYILSGRAANGRLYSYLHTLSPGRRASAPHAYILC